jgi:alkylation response protein AidB-like acyl-CoA dehydrogenase
MASSAPAVTADPFTLPPYHAQLRSDARDVAAQFAARAREIRQHLLDRGELHPELWTAFCQRGWPGMALPLEYGGSDGGLLGLALVLEAFAEQNIILWMPVLSAAIGHAIAQAGPQSAREVWLPRVASGESLLAMAATEGHSGHNLFRSMTEIRRDGDHFVVRGSKSITSGIDVADRVLVFGRPPRADGRPAGQYTAVLVDPRARGVDMTELPMRHREGVRQYQLELDDVVVRADDVIGGEGRGLMVMWPFTHVERILTAAVCLGMASYCVTQAVARAKQRVIGGNAPIGAHQSIGHPLARLHVRRQATRLFVYRTAATFDNAATGPDLAGDANMAKLLTADLVFDAADHAVQVFGADAWDERMGWLDIYLDARLSRSGPVSNEFALNFVAEHVLGLPVHQ